MTPLECDNKLVTYHSWFFCPLLDHQADSSACLQNGGAPQRKKEKENYASSKKLLTSSKEKGPLGKKSPFTRKEKEGSVRIRRVAGRQASRPLLIGLKVGRTLKKMSGLNKLMSIVHRMRMVPP